MDRHLTGPPPSHIRPASTLSARVLGRLPLRALALALLVASLLVPAAAARAASLTMTVEPMLGGVVRPGAWAGFRVHLENDGPAVSGELRITGGSQGDSSYGTAVELPTGARQDHLLYAQPAWFGAKLQLKLVQGTTVLLSQDLKVTTLDPTAPAVFVVAERPEGIMADIRAGVASPNFTAPSVMSVAPRDLPPRVEAWSAIDRLIWQDADSSQLSTEQLAALQTWLSAGGRLVIMGGTTGTTGLSALPADILPFTPTVTADASTSDLSSLLGTLPVGATTSPVLAGTLDHGTVLGRTGDHVFAAQAAYGQGGVTIVGVDPAASWLKGTATATALWRRVLPISPNGIMNPLGFADDSMLVGALNNLPAVELPRIEQLFVLLLAYILLIGPINYLVLRRLDKREWAWVTMPVLVGVFAVAAYGLGLGLKGTDIIVNEVGIVHGAAGTDRGVGQYYIGVFSPTRQTFDVRVANAALLTNPTYIAAQGQTGVPLDVVLGETSHLRGYQVGFGVLRSFRAEASVAAPRVDSDLRYSGGHLTGTLTNRSDRTLEQVAVVYGGGARVVGSLAPAGSAQVDLDVGAGSGTEGQSLSEKLFGTTFGGTEARNMYTRRAVIDQLSNYSSSLGGYGAVVDQPVILAWTSGAGLPVDVGADAHAVGDTLALLPATVAVNGPTLFTSSLIHHSVVSSVASDASDQGQAFSLSRGTMTVEFRPIAFTGGFTPSSFSLLLTQGGSGLLSGVGVDATPLPADQQPDQEDPVGDTVRGPQGDGGSDDSGGGVVPPAGGAVGGGGVGGVPVGKPLPGGAFFDGLPELQLYDNVARAWVEFSHLQDSLEYRITSPERYVDPDGRFLVRFVNRGDESMGTYFSLLARLDGDVE